MTDGEEYADEAGDVISIYQCPGCSEGLRVEFRENVPAHMIGLACPNGCVGLPVRIRDAARLDETFETRQPWRCYECREEIHEDSPPETENGWPLHPGECAEAYRDDVRRLRAVGGEPHE